MMQYEKDLAIPDFGNGRRPGKKKCGQPRCWKGKKMDYPLEPPEKPGFQPGKTQLRLSEL